MKKFWLCLNWILTAAFLCTGPLAQKNTDKVKNSEKKWDISAVHGPVTELEFETAEGTWMSVDVSPDGRQIVFDLLGDIYIMPVSGGNASALTGGPAMDLQPRFSPDGKKISFTSDRDGIDNLWIMDSGGKNAKQVSAEKERQVNNGVWSPDGQYLVGRKHFRNTRSLGAGEIWMYHISGGKGLQVTKRKNWQQDAGEPCFSPDGRYLYYSEDITPGGRFEYNKNPHGIIYVIQRRDLRNGKTEQYIRAAGGSARPEVSPDGKSIAFVRRIGVKTALMVYNVASGRETMLYDELDHDQQEAWAIFGIYPGFSWTPDGKSIVIWAKGGIKKIEVKTREVSDIPFKLSVKQKITNAVHFPQKISTEKFSVRNLRWVTVSPDEKSVVFEALGKLWIRNLPDGKPKRLTGDGENLEMYPSFSHDSKWITYTTWHDEKYGSLWRVGRNGKNRKKLISEKGTYIEPSFSPDGKMIVFRKRGGDRLRGSLYSDNTGIYKVPAAGGRMQLITESGLKPRFTKSGERLFLLDVDDEKVVLVSVGLKGEDRFVHLSSDNAREIVPSPDEKWVALVERYHVYVAAFPGTGQAVSIAPDTKSYPLKRVSRDAGTWPCWTADSKKLYWSLGPELYNRDLKKTFSFVPGAPDSLEVVPDSIGLFISFETNSDIPGGRLALTGATVITMDGDRVIKNATILINKNRITAIGSASEIKIPGEVTRIDVKGKYIMPGIIDVHAHGNFETMIPQTNWRFYANLAFGVTTMHDPSARTSSVFANAEMIRADLRVGPRLFSTGEILYGAEGSYKAIVKNYDDALSHLRRLKAIGAFSVKSYNQPRRDQRQQIAKAGRELGMLVFPEGGSTFWWNLSMILDGHPGIEHNLPIAPLYKDVLQLITSSQTGLTPTLVVNYGGLSGEYYWYQHDNVWENERLMTFTPADIVNARSRRREMAAEDDYYHFETVRALKEVVDGGGRVQLGGHGQLQGLGCHWELWMLTQGGMSNMQALRCATINGAWYLGMDHELGSLTKGKLADLIVLDKNPLEDIRNSETVRYVMINGRLYDATTMNEVGNHPRKRGKFYWER